MQEKDKDKYQGWANYETWTVSLWLNNDEPSCRHWRHAASIRRSEAAQCDQVIDGTWTVAEAERFNLADQLKSEITDAAPLKDASMYCDLLDAALSEVDWHEIAQNMLDDLDDEETPAVSPAVDTISTTERTQPVTFSLGFVCSTPAALDALTPRDIASALARHAQGDWGDVCEEDRLSNEEALNEGFRLFSVYHGADGVKFWVITEADRSVTTVLLPSDY